MRRALEDRSFLLELFALSNLAFLTLDVYLAHSINAFRHPAEWIPVAFAAAGSAALAAALAASARRGGDFLRGAARGIGLAVGWGAVAVGFGGLLYHLESRFFQELTLESLVYSAPFAAPLAFAGLGLLLVMNRMVPARSPEWSRWVLLFALGGFAGNFALSLADHAQNGFFDRWEWAAVVASALAVGFLVVAVALPAGRGFLAACSAILALQVVIGILGFGLHLRGGLGGAGRSLPERLLYGPPPFAPLLFADLALLAGLGLLELWRRTPAAEPANGPR